MKKILITGGNGYIGQYLVKHFLKKGYQVNVTLRDTKINHTLVPSREMNLLDTKSIKDVCEGMDIVIHTATMSEKDIIKNPREALLINGYATRELYLDAVNCGVSKFIYLSTFHVYGSSQGHIDENSIPSPRSDYGITHYIAEIYLQQLSTIHSLPCSIMRLSNGIGAPLIGVDKWYLVLNDFCKTLYETSEIIIKSKGLELRDFIGISDVTNAMEYLIEYPKAKYCDIYNVSSNEAISIRELMQRVVSVYQTRYNIKAIISAPEVETKDLEIVDKLNLDNDKLCSLGWKPTQTIENVINEIFDNLELNERQGH